MPTSRRAARKERQEADQRRVALPAAQALATWQRRLRGAMLGVIPATIAAAACVVVPAAMWARDLARPHAEATVTELTIPKGGTVVWDDGVVREARVDSFSTSFAIGDTVSIVYAPDSPGQARQQTDLWPTLVIGGSGVGLWVMIVPAVWVQNLRPLRRRVALARNGGSSRMVTAKVARCSLGPSWQTGLAFWLDGGGQVGRDADLVVALEGANAELGPTELVEVFGQLEEKGAVLVRRGDDLFRTHGRVQYGRAWQPLHDKPIVRPAEFRSTETNTTSHEMASTGERSARHRHR